MTAMISLTWKQLKAICTHRSVYHYCYHPVRMFGACRRVKDCPVWDKHDKCYRIDNYVVATKRGR